MAAKKPSSGIWDGISNGIGSIAADIRGTVLAEWEQPTVNWRGDEVATGHEMPQVGSSSWLRVIECNAADPRERECEPELEPDI